ncbi:MAG: ABC transporter ATP-binding protein [Kurthia sp.]|nr:ABC transporter ATP-binding protein [Candidatus Kurthia equi]
MNAIVEIKDLNKTIKSKHIIKNLNLALYPGQITGFLGPNGAGKTTTIRMMTGLMKPTSGDVLINGQSIRNNYEEAIKHVGVIVENPEMYKFMTGYKNLVHFANMHKDISKQRIDEVVELMGLTNRIHEKVSTYSLGMRQRLGLAQALLHKPKFLILDEPTNGLDPAGIKELRQLLRKLADEQQVSVLVSSHLLAEIELMCDKIAIIQNGELTNIREMQATEVSRYSMELQGPAEELLQALAYNFSSTDNLYTIEVEHKDVPSLITKLVQANISIYSVLPYHESLEDQFLEMTGGGQIVEAHTK